MMAPSTAQGTALFLMSVIVAAATVSSVSAHGYMSMPKPRNWLNAHKNGFYNEMSLHSPGTGICGGLNAQDNRFAAGGSMATRNIAARYTQGGVIQMTTQIWNNHWGYLELRLCPLSNPSTAAEKSELTDDCLQMHRLKLVNGKGYFHWIYRGKQGERFIEKGNWRLPADVTCARCVLQWRWVTGHMCRLPGIDPAFTARVQPRIDKCPKNYLDNLQYPPEKFFNCADISISKSNSRRLLH